MKINKGSIHLIPWLALLVTVERVTCHKYSVRPEGTWTGYYNAGTILRLNGERIAHIGTAHAYALNKFSTAAIHSTLKLKAGDLIDLYLGGDGMYDNHFHHSHLTGWLLHEDMHVICIEKYFLLNICTDD